MPDDFIMGSANHFQNGFAEGAFMNGTNHPLPEPSLANPSEDEERESGISLPSRRSVLQGLSEALMRRSLTKIDVSQRGLQACDARLIKMVLAQNPHVRVLKLGYNNFGDEGVAVLAPAVAHHESLESIDLGFNKVGDEGCKILMKAILQAENDGRIWTLYLAGNVIREDGAMSVADVVRRGFIRELYLTGNRLGPGGVRAITQAVVEAEAESRDQQHVQQPHNDSQPESLTVLTEASPEFSLFAGMQQLFLGGTDDMGSTGSDEALSQLLSSTCSLKTLSIPNCDITDEALAKIASSIKSNRYNLPLQKLQLSFNNITCRGMESLSNAIWGSTSLTELMLDNNEIGDTGVHLLSTVLPYVKSLEKLDVGFNKIKVAGMKLLMKAVADSVTLRHLCLSGNQVDVMCSKYIAYALAHSSSLLSVSLDHCSIIAEGHRQIVAGIVSNRRVALRKIRGFDIGPVVVTLGFPGAMEHWHNEHVLNFVRLMWEKCDPCDLVSNEEKTIDPLHFLPSNSNGSSFSTHSPARTPPLQAHVVVEVAKNAFSSLVQDGVDVFSRASSDLRTMPSIGAVDAFFRERHNQHHHPQDSPSENSLEPMSSQQNRSFVAPPPEASIIHQLLPDPSRKKRIVEWLCSHIQHLNKMSQKPFSSAELWKLHQHYFAPVVNESGGCVAPSQTPSADLVVGGAVSSVPEVSITNSSENHGDMMSEWTEGSISIPLSDPSMRASPPNLSSLPMLKRKVSYRFLGDAAVCATAPRLEFRFMNRQNCNSSSVSLMIEGGPTGHSMPPKTKRARRNRSRISFLPRVKAKLDSLLDVCHEKALVTMRQLYYVEQAILSGQVNPVDPAKTVRTHLCGDFAADAETIVVDMI